MKFNILFVTITCLVFFSANTANAQNKRIKCYFNHPVNNRLATGTNAVYLNNTFPDTIAAYINRAKYSIDGAIYNFTSNGTDSIAKIVKAINAAYNRGVKVRWIYDGSSNNTGVNLLNININKLPSPTSSGYTIMHNKFLVIDAKSADTTDPIVLTGSTNFTVQQTNTDYNNIIIIQQHKVAQAYYAEFNKMWGDTTMQPNTTKSTFGSYKSKSANEFFNVDGRVVEVHFSPNDSCGKYLQNVINSANNDLTFGIYAFTFNPFANSILSRFNAGVNTRGIIDNFSQSYSPYTTLSPLGQKLTLFSGLGIYHNKILIADALKGNSDAQVATGSFNWSAVAQSDNDENLIIVHDSAIANQYYQAVCKNITDNGGVGCIAPLLPVVWRYVTATEGLHNTITINWATALENNNDHFEIERSTNGIIFNKIGEELATNTSKGSTYKFIDLTPSNGINYYRIKQIDIDGNTTFSKQVTAIHPSKTSVSITPNPANNLISITLPISCNKIIFYNSVGIVEKQLEVSGSNITTSINHLPTGLHFVLFFNHNSLLTTEKLSICH